MARSSGFDSGELPDAAVHVLLALTQPRHGYAVMQFLETQSRGTISIGPASLYTTLKKLVNSDLINEVYGNDARRVYEITSKGQEVLALNIERRQQLLTMAENILEKNENH